MTVERLPPGTFVEVFDVMSGSRKIGLVDDTGMGYFDIHRQNELPKPLFSELAPVSLGSIASWVSALDGEAGDIALAIWDELTKKNLDVLTIARSMRWAIINQSVEIELIEKMGRDATQQILMAREVASKAVTTA